MLGERIRREKIQMNQMEFSNRVGVSQGTLSELDQNKYNLFAGDNFGNYQGMSYGFYLEI